MSEFTAAPRVAPDEALRQAHADATQAYRDLSQYQIRLALEPDGWHVDYRTGAFNVTHAFRRMIANHAFGPPSENVKSVASGFTSTRAGRTDSTSQPLAKAS